uniref:Uncharacterized protein n=1 Tax=Schlesneria paludicola TaxID=360056 RepID=A0A7C4QRG5_9PLAN
MNAVRTTSACRPRAWLPGGSDVVPGPRGTTLSEVLISTLVMSIGVVALASLFPISVLRSIQASQLTNAANLRYNAEAHLRTMPELIHLGREWQPGTPYAQGDAVVPSFNQLTTARPAVFVCTQGGLSGGAEPAWDYREGQPTNDGTVVWSTITLGNAPYVVDPLGFLLVDPADPDGQFRNSNPNTWFPNPNPLRGAQQHFGNLPLNGPGNPVTPFNQFINRFPAFGFFLPSATPEQNEVNAARLAVLPDSWTLQAESLDLANLNTTTTATSIDLTNIDPNVLSQSVQVPTPDLVPDRIVFFDATGRRSIARPIIQTPTAAAVGTTVTCAPPLPFGFMPVKVRVESLERRYSYLLSVRRKTGRPANVDVVVFFRRRFAVEDEQVYSAVFRKIDRGADGQPGNAGVDDNKNGTNDDLAELGAPNSDDKPRNFVIVQYNSAAEKPFFKKGGFVCDAQNLRWYRIIDVTEDPLAALATSQAQRIQHVTPAGYEQDPEAPNADRAVRLTLDRNIVEDSLFLPGTLTPLTSSGILGGAILMRGVVDVFPLRPRQATED